VLLNVVHAGACEAAIGCLFVELVAAEQAGSLSCASIVLAGVIQRPLMFFMAHELQYASQPNQHLGCDFRKK
jgi:hypothetical protein